MAQAEAPSGASDDVKHIPGLEGKRVMVTGGSAGIGRAAVLTLAASGATVAAAARHRDRLDEVVAAAPKGSTVYRVQLDLTLEDSCRAAVKEAVSQMGGLDVVVNCGGIIVEGVEDKAFELFSSMTALHVASVWLITQEALPELKKGKRSAVVNLSSVVAKISTSLAEPKLIAYHAVKAAQDQVTKSLALQLAKDGVRVNAVAPGAIHTPGLEKFASEGGKPVEQGLKALAKAHPIGRVGKPQEVANVIAFLSSDLATFVTGAIVPVDGGSELTSLHASLE